MALTTAQRNALTNALPSWSGIKWRVSALEQSQWASGFLAELDRLRAIAGTTTTTYYQARHRPIIIAVGLTSTPYDTHVAGG